MVGGPTNYGPKCAITEPYYSAKRLLD